MGLSSATRYVRKPTNGAAIDWGHPLAKGIIFCAITSPQLRQELASGYLPVYNTANGSFSATVLGEGFTQGTPGQSFISYNPSAFLVAQNFTILVICQPISFSGNFGGTDASLLCQPHDTGLNSPYSRLALGRNGTGSDGAAYYANSGTRYSAVSSSGFIQTSDPLTHYAVTRNGTTATFYRNGVVFGSTGTFGADLPVSFSVEPIALMAYSSTNNANCINGPCAGAVIWNRALMAGELLELYRAPFGFLQPQPSAYHWALQAAAAGPEPLWARQMISMP